MTQPTLAERVTALEREVADLKAALTDGVRPKDWRRTIGMFSGDEVMKRIDEAARKFREADRRKARRRQTKGRQAKA
jgi:hypothetical protein